MYEGHEMGRVLPVFIASPSDVADERNIIASIINELSTALYRSFRVSLQVRRWEDFAPISRRPTPAIQNT